MLKEDELFSVSSSNDRKNSSHKQCKSTLKKPSTVDEDVQLKVLRNVISRRGPRARVQNFTDHDKDGESSPSSQEEDNASRKKLRI